MMPADWVGLFGALLAGAVVAALVVFGLRGGRFWRVKRVSFVCPRLQQRVDCRIVRDFRTSQWKRIEACSAFEHPEEVTCEPECLRRLNLGLRLEETKVA